MKNFDFFPKIQQESQRKTSEGGLISLIGVILGIILLINEIIYGNTTTTLERLQFFEQDKPDLTIHLDVSFFHLKCDEIELKVTTGKAMVNSGLQDDGNSGWSVRDMKKTSIFENEGCQLVTEVDIKKYESGEMHVTLAPHLLAFGQIGITIDDYFKFNSSHQISAFAIGSLASKLQELESTSFDKKLVPSHGTGRFIYDFHAVPEVISSSDTVKYLLQIREQDVITTSENEGMFALQKLGLPGVFITLQLSTLMIDKVAFYPPYYEVFISLLGIVAGTSTIIAFIDSMLHEALWKKKLD